MSPIARLTIPVVLAAAGIASLVWMFPRVDAAVEWRLTYAREQGIARARAIARQQGWNVDGWTASVRSSSSLWVREWFRAHPRDPMAPFSPSWRLQVMLRDPGADHSIGLDLGPRGELLEFREIWRVPPKPRQASTPDARAEIAGRWFRELSGPLAPRFQQVNRDVRQGTEDFFAWEWNDPAMSPHAARVEVVVEGDRLKQAQVAVIGARSYVEPLQARQSAQAVGLAIVMLLVSLVCFTANPVFFRALVRGRLPKRRLAAVGAGAALLWLIGQFGGIWLDGIRFTAAESFAPIATGMIGTIIGWTLLIALIIVFYGAGRALIAGEDVARWIGLEQLLRGAWLSQRVGLEWAAGTAIGIATCAATLVLPALIVLDSTPLTGSSDLAGFRWAEVWPIRQFTLFFTVGIWFAVWPICAHLIPWGKPWLGRILFAAAATCTCGFTNPILETGVWPNVVGGALTAAGMWAAYRWFGLLAALSTSVSLFAAIAAATAWVQPSAEWMATGWRIAGIYGGLGVVGLLVAWQGRPVDETAESARISAETTHQTGGDRDRLSAEFEVARRAQQGMLPEVPPRVGDIELAASCQPAREVGGDLYDFYPMGDDRYGICVADVSGKGVPASLYMSLTKGYLAAAGPEERDLKATLTDLNGHLYANGKKRIFVTMALGVLDAGSRTLELARAGHNAVLWRRTKRAESQFLQPKGMGLGMTSRLIFERTLELQQIALEPGDVVVFYSDGVPEAMNIDREQFTEDRLVAVVEQCDGLSAAQIQSEIARELHRFIGAAPPHDDITLFVLRWGENSVAQNGNG